jgi:hypothetical protein
MPPEGQLEAFRITTGFLKQQLRLTEINDTSKMEAASFSATLVGVTNSHTTRHPKPEDHILIFTAVKASDCGQS